MGHPPSIKRRRLLPLFEIIKIGDSDPQPMPDGDRPLSHCVADMTRVIAGPMCGRNSPSTARRLCGSWPPFFFGSPGHRYWYGKIAAEIDLASQVGKETMRDLIKSSDVFSQGYRPGTIANRGFSPEEMAAIRPGIVCVSLCAFSHAGLWQHKRGFDSIVQCCTGLVHEHSE